MDRRTCLKLFGTTAALGLAGCLSNGSGDAPATDPPGASPTSDPETDSPTGTPIPDPATGTPTPDPATGTPTPDRDGSGTETPPAVTPPDVETPAPGNCEATAPPSPSTGEGLPDPKPYPDRPPSLTEAAVKPFLEDYESAYRFNVVLADLAEDGGCVRNVGVSPYGSRVSSVDDGVAGTVETFASYTGTHCEEPTGTVTPTPLPHADLPILEARYYVTDRFLIRNDAVVECWS